jgi:hypothetical protein
MKIFLVIFTLFIVRISLSQDSLNWGIEIKPKLGFLLAKRGEVGHLPRSHSFGGEISYVNHTNGRKKWHSTFNYPTIGATLFFGSPGNKDVLGSFLGSYAFMEFPFYKSDHYEVLWKVGTGLGYGDKVYDPITNPKNSVISTHVNALVCFGFQQKFVFNKHYLLVGVDLTHFSNAANKVPNIGVNMPFLSLGYGYRIVKTQHETALKNTLVYHKLFYGVTGIFSGKEIFPTGNGRSLIYGLSANVRCFFKPKLGAEISLDMVSKQSTLKYKPDIEKTQLDLIQVGVFAGYVLPLDRFQLMIGMGMNVRDKFQPESFLYHKVGMRYYFNNGIHINYVLRSNWAKADFFECGLGYTFNSNTK